MKPRAFQTLLGTRRRLRTPAPIILNVGREQEAWDRPRPPQFDTLMNASVTFQELDGKLYLPQAQWVPCARSNGSPPPHSPRSFKETAKAGRLLLLVGLHRGAGSPRKPACVNNNAHYARSSSAVYEFQGGCHAGAEARKSTTYCWTQSIQETIQRRPREALQHVIDDQKTKLAALAETLWKRVEPDGPLDGRQGQRLGEIRGP